MIQIKIFEIQDLLKLLSSVAPGLIRAIALYLFALTRFFPVAIANLQPTDCRLI